MTPKQFIKYTQKLDKKGLAICDGTTTEMHTGSFDILYIFFTITGLTIFMWILMKWTRFKERLFDGECLK